MDIPKEIEEKIKAPKVEEIEIKVEEIKAPEIEDISADFEKTLKVNADKEDKKTEIKVEDIAHDELKEDFEDMQNDFNYLPFVIGGGVLLLGGIGALLYFGKDTVNTSATVEAKGADSWTS